MAREGEDEVSLGPAHRQALHALRTSTSAYIGIGSGCTFSCGSGLRIPWRLMESLEHSGWAAVHMKDKLGPVWMARITPAGIAALETQRETA